MATPTQNWSNQLRQRQPSLAQRMAAGVPAAAPNATTVGSAPASPADGAGRGGAAVTQAASPSASYPGPSTAALGSFMGYGTTPAQTPVAPPAAAPTTAAPVTQTPRAAAPSATTVQGIQTPVTQMQPQPSAPDTTIGEEDDDNNISPRRSSMGIYGQQGGG